MPNQHTVTLTYKSEGGTSTITNYVFDCGKSINVEEDIPIGATDLELAIDIPSTADTLGFAFGAKKKAGQAASANTVELEIRTNAPSTGTPDDSFTITDTNGFGWNNADPVVNPLTAAVTSLFITNTGNAIAELSIRAGIDPTI